MNQILAYMGRDPKLVGAGLSEAQLDGWSVEGESGWGIGYEEESRMLVRKHPQGASGPVVIAGVVEALRTRGFVAQSGWHESATRSSENTQPHRWRHLLCAMSAGLPQMASRRQEILSEMPDFLRRNVRGQSDSELLFHRFLVHLKREAGLLESPVLPLEPAIEALKRWVEELRGWVSEDGAEALSFALVLTSGRELMAVTLGVPLWVCHVEGVEVEGREHPDYRAVVLLGGEVEAPSGFEAVPVGEICAVGKKWVPVRAPLV